MFVCRHSLISLYSIALIVLPVGSGFAGEIHLLTFEGPITPVASMDNLLKSGVAGSSNDHSTAGSSRSIRSGTSR